MEFREKKFSLALYTPENTKNGQNSKMTIARESAQHLEIFK
jgi:hypothetical protein